MANKRKPGFSKAILNLIILVPTIFSLFSKIFALVGLEARLAGRSLVTILILAILFGMVLTTTWLCVLSLLLVYLITQMSLVLSLGIIIAINLFLLLVIAFAMSKMKNNLSFPVIRRHFSRHASEE
jgi:hypothetical protein